VIGVLLMQTLERERRETCRGCGIERGGGRGLGPRRGLERTGHRKHGRDREGWEAHGCALYARGSLWQYYE